MDDFPVPEPAFRGDDHYLIPDRLSLRGKAIPFVPNQLPIANDPSQSHLPEVVAGPPLKINLIARTNGVGLDRDVDLVAATLEAAGHLITRSHCREIPFWRQWSPTRPRFDLNIFMERVFPRWISSAHSNVLIPNQERFPERHLRLLGKINHVLCKSEHALEIFSRHHPSCHLSRFTSQDLYLPDVERTFPSFLHLAGRSTLKGTSTLLELWQRHPEWPELLLLQHRENAPDSVPENVTLRADYVPEEELHKLLNSRTIHLCPSLSEGWGHYIVEAMACKAVVITTDGPPMNELVSPERGRLVKVASSAPRHLGTNFHVDPTSLEQTISDLLSSSTSSLKETGDRARDWFLANDTEFRKSLPPLLESFRPESS
ncbi:MAG: glycosyltransferase [Akkermansiaceae bacterium]